MHNVFFDTRRPMKFIYYFGLAIVFVAQPSVMMSQDQPTSKATPSMNQQIEQINQTLSTFSTDTSVEQLKQAYNSMADMTALLSKSQPAVPREELGGVWLALLATIEKYLDPSYDHDDPKNQFAINLAPPPDSDGRCYPSGASSDSLKDPTIRANYEKALDENAQKRARSEFQNQLRRMDRSAGFGVLNFRNKFYNNSATEKAEFNSLVGRANLSESKKIELTQ